MHKVTTLLVDGRRVRLQLWDTSGQGRFCTILRSYSRGAQGLLLVYDLTNKWSFDGIDRWRREVEEVCSYNSTILPSRTCTLQPSTFITCSMHPEFLKYLWAIVFIWNSKGQLAWLKLRPMHNDMVWPSSKSLRCATIT